VFDPTLYGSAFGELLREERLAELGPGHPDEPVRGRLHGLAVEKAFEGKPLRDRDMARCCISAVWLYHDFLDESHTISQEIETTTGSYWHGLMHRREPDYFNSKYWFRRVGDHAAFGPLSAAAREAAQTVDEPKAAFLKHGGGWDPFAYVDLCESAAGRGSPAEQLCRHIQLLEWQILFDHCYRSAVGEKAM
jgi:hypothetical protein